MALADTARLIATLELQDKFSGTAAKFNQTVTGLDQRSQRLGQLGQHIGQGVRSTITNLARIGVVAGGAIAVNVKAGIESLGELQRVEQLTATALKSTGSAAGGSAKQIRDRAVALEDLTTVDDKAIQNAENLLLTFRQIGPQAFDPTLKAAIDLNAAMGGDENSLQGALIQVGKAVNDPIKGLTALRRVGVSFTADQEKQIKGLVEAGRAMDAQKLILRELEKEFGGAGKAFGTGPAADMRRFGDAIEDAQQALATGFLPLIRDVSQRVQEALGDPKVLANIRGLGEGLAGAVGNLIDIGTRLPWGAIGSAAKLMGEGAKGLLQAFTSLPPWIQTAVLTGWGLNKLTGGALGNIFGDVIKLAFPKLDIFSRGSPANPMFTKEVGLGGVPGVGGGGGFIGGAAKGIGAVIGAAAAFEIGNVLGHSLFFDPTVKPAVTFETSQFDKLVASAEGDPARLQHAIDVIQKGLDDMPLPAQLLARDQITELERQRDQLIALRDSAVKQAQAAQTSNRNERDMLNEAKAGRLAIVHQGELTQRQLERLNLEQRLQRDPNFRQHITSPEAFIRLLRRTSEFGAKGVGTTIEQGKTTGRDPVGDAFVALVGRLNKTTLANPQVQGEISRHIKALEQVQTRLLNKGQIADAKHAQQNINRLEKLIGEVDKTIPHFRHLADVQQQTRLATDRGTQKTGGLLGNILGTNRTTATNTGILTRKNYSPRVAVTVNSTANVSVDNVIRSVTHTTTALGSGPGGPILSLNG